MYKTNWKAKTTKLSELGISDINKYQYHVSLPSQQKDSSQKETWAQKPAIGRVKTISPQLPI